VSEAVTAEHDLIGAVQTGPGDQDGRLRRLVLPPSLRFAKNVFGVLPDEKRAEHSRGRRSGRAGSAHHLAGGSHDRDSHR
jgi:hypothetical protein